MTKVEIYKEKPKSWPTNTSFSAGWLCCGDKFLFLQRRADAEEPLCWGVPGGKLDPGETAVDALIREINEETGIVLSKDKTIHIDDFFIQKKRHQYGYHMFFSRFDNRPKVVLSSEHYDFKWVTLDEAEIMPLMLAGRETIDIFKQEAAFLELFKL